jgi:hypothetical protein
MLFTATFLVLGAGLDLFLFPEATDTMFAWSIQPALTAAFLGANYLAAGVLEFGAARQITWARARAAVPAVLLFTVLTALLTLRNFNDYNLGNPMAWVWISVYFGVPPVLALVWWQQCATSGSEPPREAPLPRTMRSITVLLGVTMIGFGLALIVAPRSASPLWPWSLTFSDNTYGSSGAGAMEAYVGIWLLAWGSVMLHAAIENDLLRTGYVFAALAALAVLQSLAIHRFSPIVIWRTPAAIYFAVLAVVGAVGFWGWIAAVRARKPPRER